MGIFDSLFGSSKNVTTTRPQVMEGLEPLVPELSRLAQQAYGRPYQAYTAGARIAPFSRSQQAGMRAFEGIATDPSYQRGMGQAGEAIGSSMDDQNLQAMIRSLGRNITPERTRAGRTSARGWTDPGTASSYMNPYKSNVIDQWLNREDKRTDTRRAGLDAKLAGKRAFGSRGDLARTQFESDEEDRKGQAIADMLDKGYESGANIFRSDADRGLTSETGNVDRALTSSTGNANRALSAEQLRTQGIGQGVTGENTRLAGRRAAGNDLASLTDRYRTGMTENAKNLMNIGQMEQTQGQKPLDLQYQDWMRQQNFPAEQATGLSRIVYGAPTGSTTTTPGPSGASQLLGAGIGAYGLGSGMGWWKRGGKVGRFADGGFDDENEQESDESLLAALSDPMLDPATKEAIRERLKQNEGLAPKGIGAPPIDMHEQPDGSFGVSPPGPLETAAAPPSPSASPSSPGGDGGDPYSGLLAKLVEAQDPKASRGMILARLGAAMASSRQPGFLGPVGEGLGAAAKGMENEQQRRLRALGQAAGIEERRQAAKDRAENTKTAAQIRKDDLADRAQNRKDMLALRQQQADDMKAYRDAMANQENWMPGGITPEGNVVLINKKSGDTKIIDAKPKPTGSGKQSVYEMKKADWLAIHPEDQEGAAKFASGQKQFSRADAERLANQLAKTQSAQEANPLKGPEVYKRIYEETLKRHGFDPAGAAQTPNVSRETPNAVSPPAPVAPPPAAAPPAGALPLPKDKAQLKAGTVYQTARGPARWNGTAFVPASQ